MAFEHFPYTNFHDLNLDWMLEEFGKIRNSIGDFIEQWDELKNDYYDGIRPDYEQLRESFADIQQRYNAMEAAWNSFKNTEVPATIAAQVDAAHQDMQDQYNAFFSRYQRDWGISLDFGDALASSIAQKTLTEKTLRYWYEWDSNSSKYLSVAPIDSNVFRYFSATEAAQLPDHPLHTASQRTPGVFISFGRANAAGFLDDELLQMYIAHDSAVAKSIIYIRYWQREHDADPWIHVGAVSSVNSHEGDVVLNARDVGADPAGELTIGGVEYTLVKTNMDSPQGNRVITFVTE